MEPSLFVEHVSFRPAVQEDLPLLLSWLKKEYIREYWGDGGLAVPDFKKFVSAQPSLFAHYFAVYHGISFAYLMTSPVNDDEPLAQWKETNESLLTFDFLIGDERFLGKGLSHLVIEKFFYYECSEVASIITDPEARNSKAIHVYEKAGFAKLGDFYPTEGPWVGKHHFILKKKIHTI